MRRGRIFSVVALCLAALSLLVFSGGQFQGPAEGNHLPRLTVAENTRRFGSVYAQAGFEWNISLQNAGDSDLEIENLTASCTCTAVEPSSLRIPARGNASLRAILDLRPGKGSADRSPQAFAVTFTARVKDRRGAVVGWELTGTVLPHPIHPSEPAVKFFDPSFVQGHDIPAREIVVQSQTRLRRLEARIEPPGSAALEQSEIQAGSEYRIRVAPKISEPGLFQASLILTATADGEESIPPLIVPVAGELLGPVEMLPPALTIGARAVGTLVDEVVSLRSRDSQPFAVTSIETSDPATTIFAVADETRSGFEQRFRVRHQIKRPGPATAFVTFHIEKQRTRDSPLQSTARLRISLHGIAPE